MSFSASGLLLNTKSYEKILYVIHYIETNGAQHVLKIILYGTINFYVSNHKHFEPLILSKNLYDPIHFANFTYHFMINFFEKNEKNPLFTCLFFPDTEYGMIGFFSSEYICNFNEFVDKIKYNYTNQHGDIIISSKLINEILLFMSDFTSIYCYKIYKKYFSHFTKNLIPMQELTNEMVCEYIDQVITQLNIIEQNYKIETQEL